MPATKDKHEVSLSLLPQPVVAGAGQWGNHLTLCGLWVCGSLAGPEGEAWQTLLTLAALWERAWVGTAEPGPWAAHLGRCRRIRGPGLQLGLDT